MSDARRYAVWPDLRSRSRSLKGSRPSVPHGTNFFTFTFYVTLHLHYISYQLYISSAFLHNHWLCKVPLQRISLSVTLISTFIIIIIIIIVLVVQVKGMGMDSPELLLLVENCPRGAETLVTRIIHILTDKGLKTFPCSRILWYLPICILGSLRTFLWLTDIFSAAFSPIVHHYKTTPYSWHKFVECWPIFKILPPPDSAVIM